MYYGLNRTLCDVLKEMRVSYETRNFSYLSSLIEEAQMMGNRMEAKLADIRDLEYMERRYKELRKEVNKLEEASDAKDMPSV